MATRREIAAKMPKWAKVLFEPQWRYISLRGGRGSGKTKNIARALILKASQAPIRVLCTREVQDTIKDSVYEQLKVECNELGLTVGKLAQGADFEFQVDGVKARSGAVFMFKGLNEFSVGGVKSTTDVDVAWVEEAQYITQKSWEAFTPTIRGEGSQIWLSWNPELETDFIYEKVVKEGLPKCASLFINFDQNPWFPEVLRLEEQDMAARDPIRHRHVWLGEPLPAVESAIYFDEIARMEREERVRFLTEESLFQTYIVMDLGIRDYTSAIVVQQGAGEMRFIDFIENNRVAQSWFSEQFTERGYDDAIICLPHDGRAQNSHTALTTEQLYQGLGWNVEIVENIGIEEGIRMAREMLPSTYIDKSRCAALIEHLKRYQRNKHGYPVHDEHSHACDAVRYVAVHQRNMTNSKGNWGGKLNYRNLVVR